MNSTTTSSEEKEMQEEKTGHPSEEPCFKIANLGNLKGDGLIATRDIKAGELILKENAILINDCEEGYTKAFKLMKEKHGEWLKILPYYKKKVGKKATEFEIFKSQVQRCSFVRQDSELRSTHFGKKRHILCLYISKINHSCLPNASKSVTLMTFKDSINTINGRATAIEDNYDDNIEKQPSGIHALRDICKGEEITIFYHPGLLFLPTNQRRIQLKKCYGFDCQCTRCIYTNNSKKSNKHKNKNTKKQNNGKNEKSKHLQQEIERAITFETLLKSAKFPKNIANNKSAQNKYFETMKQEFDTINESFASTDTILDSGKSYNINSMINRCGTLINSTNKFLKTYENTFLYPTHWRIIKMKRLADFSVRFYGGLFFDSGIKDMNTLKQFLKETIFDGRLTLIISLMKSQHTILIEKLKYKYFNHMMCVNISYFDTWLAQWQSIHYDKNDIENDIGKKYCIENGIDALTRAKEKLSYLANTDGSAIKCFIDSINILSVDKNALIKHQMAKFAAATKTCVGKYCWFSMALTDYDYAQREEEYKSNKEQNDENNAKDEEKYKDQEEEQNSSTIKSINTTSKSTVQCVEMEQDEQNPQEIRIVAMRDIAAGQIILTHESKDIVEYLTKLKHSCLPNAAKSVKFGQFSQLNQHSYNNTSNNESSDNDKISTDGDCDHEDDHDHDIYAMRDILTGEEITIAYDWDVLFLPTSKRLKVLETHFGFHCQCIRCQLVTNVNSKDTNYNNSTISDKDKEKVMAFEAKLQECQLPNAIAISDELKQNKYIKEMITCFEQITTVFEQFSNDQTNGKVYNGHYFLKMFRLTSQRCNDFLNDYEAKYLSSTHWRVIKIKQIKDMSIRSGLAIFAHLVDNDKQKIKNSIATSLYKELINDRLNLIQTQYQLLIENLHYSYVNDGLIVGANYVNLLLDRLFYIHYIDTMNKERTVEYQSMQVICRELVQTAKNDANALIGFVNKIRRFIVDVGTIASQSKSGDSGIKSSTSN